MTKDSPMFLRYIGTVAGDVLDVAALGRAIAARRESKGWTAYRLSRVAKVEPGYLRTIERGEGARPGVEVVARIASALGISTDLLLAEAGVGIAPVPGAGEAEVLYSRLGPVMGRAWMEMGRTLSEAAGELEPGMVAYFDENAPDVAAYDRPELAEWMRKHVAGYYLPGEEPEPARDENE